MSWPLYPALREEVYARGLAEFDELELCPTFRDFVRTYIGEGHKQDRDVVAVHSSDPSVVALGAGWIDEFSRNEVEYRIEFDADQDLVEIVRFWAGYLGVPHDQIKLQRGSNSSQLRGRTWRSEYGVLTVSTNDTLFRARLEAWMDCVRTGWADQVASELEVLGAV